MISAQFNTENTMEKEIQAPHLKKQYIYIKKSPGQYSVTPQLRKCQVPTQKKKKKTGHGNVNSRCV